jgi:hypothetical protein
MSKSINMTFVTSVILAIVGGVGIAGGNPPTTKAGAAAPEAYAPGLGDFMTAYVQPHHIKLWLAAKSGNWDLAAYEASELAETFEDVSTYQATWKDAPVAQLVKAIIQPKLTQIDSAIAHKDFKSVQSAYAELTAGCNSCHTTMHHAFLKITVPTADPFSDQNFTPL